MKVKILRPIPGWAYFGGETTEIPDERAAELIARGNAIPVPETMQEIPVIKAYVREEETTKKKTVRTRKTK
ncbi:MAG TPA: hypothetical protein PKM93_13225 [Prolixibacteraceae bacterium]|jgi:nitrate reductase beta subunit|nr:hypothetical protein [Prolixibacteraceae bacterium]